MKSRMMRKSMAPLLALMLMTLGAALLIGCPGAPPRGPPGTMAPR